MPGLKSAYLLLGSFACLSLSACAQAVIERNEVFAGAKVVDLTHSLNEQSIFWPTAERFHLEKVFDGETENGFHYAANNLHMAEHGGTHLDAPVHFARDGWTTDQIPLDRLIGRAIVVDVSRASSADRDYEVTVGDFEAWEKSHGRIGPDSIILIRTGYSRHWPDAQAYIGTAERGPQAVPQLHFPGLEPATAKWLIEQRQIKAVGIDTASIDFGQSTLFETHRALSARNVPVLENLAYLDKLPAQGATLIALPTKIEGASGGPARAIALVPQGR
jgi:kynurenine formamidase